MAYVSTAPTEYLADELAKVIDLPQSYKGLSIIFVPKTKRKSILTLPMHKIEHSSLESINMDRG
jgi:hypothetical protein